MRKDKPPTLAQRRQEAENKVATLKAHAEAAVLEQAVRLLESPQPVVVPWSEYPAFDQFSQWPTAFERPYLWTSGDDRREGRYRPYYETDQDLRVIRAVGRRMKGLFPVAEGALEALTNYTIKGIEVKVQAKRKEYEKDVNIRQAIAAVQRVVDRFLERNNFTNNLDRQIHKDSREDGEVFAVLYPDGNPRCPDEVRLELVDPDYILAPLHENPLNRHLQCGHKLNYWYHGVHTQFSVNLKCDDATRPLGYHAVFDKTGELWDYLPVNRVEHIKRNVGRAARRGVSDFFILLNDIESEAKIRRNTALGAAILAAIVMIREHAEGTSRSGVESMTASSATGTVTRYTQSGMRTINQESVRPGTIKDTPAGLKTTVGPMGTLNQPVYIEVAQYILRTIWQRWNAPEYMSGDASNANYASTLVAESPFVRGREADQLFYGTHFERLLWKAIGMYRTLGKLPYSLSTLMEVVNIKVSMASPASRDPKVVADANKVMHEAGVVSLRTWRIDAGLDPDEEEKQIAREPQRPEPVTATPFGPLPRQGSPPLSKLESLAARALSRLTESADTGRWITLDNGQHVKIDSDGVVISGPAALRGTTLNKGGTTAAASNPATSAAQSVAEEVKSRAKAIKHKKAKYLTDVDYESRAWVHDSMGQAAFGFKTSAGGAYRIDVARDEQFGGIDIPADYLQFTDKNDSFKITGSGSAHEVFGQVVPATVAYVQHARPPVLHFTAAEPSRRRLYNRLVKATAAVLPDYTAYSEDLDTGVRRYVVVHRDAKRVMGELLDTSNATRVESSSRHASTWKEIMPELDPAWFTPDGWRDDDDDDDGEQK